MTRRRPNALIPQAPIAVALTPGGRRTIRENVPPFLKWLQFVRERSENTVRAYGFDLQAFDDFCQRANLIYPDDVTVQAVEVFIAWLRQDRGASAQTANRHLHALRTFYRFAIRERQATTNPAAEAFMLKTERKLPRYLSIKEQERPDRTGERPDARRSARLCARRADALYGAARVGSLRATALARRPRRGRAARDPR